MANNQPIIRAKELDWSEAEEKKLARLYPTTDNEIIAQKLGKSVRSVRSKAQRMKLKKSNRYWDTPEEEYLLKNWQAMSAEELAEKLNKTKWGIINKYRELTGKR